MPEKLPFRVEKGALVPASRWCADKMSERGYRIGDLIFAGITKPRNPEFNAFIHAGFARVIQQNIHDFRRLSAHNVLKKIQLEADIECDRMVLNLSDGPIVYRTAKSLSFESMGEERFWALFKNMSLYIIEKYWQSATVEQIERLSDVMSNE